MASLPTFQSTTLEGAFLEAAFLLQLGEFNYYESGNWKHLGENYTVPSYINITIDTEQQRATINATVPAVSIPNSFGGYLVAYQFVESRYLAVNQDVSSVFYSEPKKE